MTANACPSDGRQPAESIWRAGLEAVSPRRLIPRFIQLHPDGLRVGERLWRARPGASLIVVGAGKAGADMSRALIDALDAAAPLPFAVDGLINVLDEQAGQAGPIRLHGARPAGSPLPTEAGVAGSRAMLDRVRIARPDDLVLCLLSGGASALLPAPPPGLPLAEKRSLTALLSRRGADIRELNVVRKHLSEIKGGHFAAASHAGLWISLILSDVIGNPLDVIASGPSVPDPSTFDEAWAILQKYRLLPDTPPACRLRLEQGRQGLIPETPKRLPDAVLNQLIADNSAALDAAADRARALGFSTHRLGSDLQGESWDLGRQLARLGLAILRGEGPVTPPACILSGGETVVSRVAPGGKGGRNQELALAFLDALPTDGAGELVLLSAGTDGEDGPTDAAGAWADAALRDRADRQGLDPADFRRRSRSYDFFESIDGLFRTGPTGTNVMDLRVLLVYPPRP